MDDQDKRSLLDQIRQCAYDEGADEAVEQFAQQFAQWDGEPAGIWVRVSSGGQDEANQVPALVEHCITRNYRPVKWYVLHDLSASKGEQQEKQDELVEDMRTSLITVGVAWKSSRWERRGNRAANRLIIRAGDTGGRLESVTQPLWATTGVIGETSTALYSAMDQAESETLRENIGLAFTRIKYNGAVGPCGKPWGYMIEGDEYQKSLVPDPEFMREVDGYNHPIFGSMKHYAVDIFERCIAGDSSRTIALWLDSIGIKPKHYGKNIKRKKEGRILSIEKWNPGSVLKILHNMTYAGRPQNEDKTITIVDSDHCAGVIDMDMFELAQNALKARPKRGPIKQDNRPLLAGLKCARCSARDIDSPMNRIHLRSRNGRLYWYYRCTGRGPQRKGCGNMIQLERLETFALVEIIKRRDEPYETKVWRDGVNYQAEISSLTQDLSELPRKIDPIANGAKFRAAQDEILAKLEDYSNREITKGGYEKEKVYNTDGSIRTEGQHFFSLDNNGRRESLREHDIKAEKVGKDIRLIIDEVEAIANPYMVALLDTVGPEITRVMLEQRIPDVNDWQALLAGLPIPGSENI